MDTKEKKDLITSWNLDSTHSEIGFKVKHLMITNVKGVFREFSGSVRSDAEDFSDAKIEVRIKAASIDTGDKNRDGHLNSADFFDAASFPEIKFTGSTVKSKKGDGTYQLTGNLEMKGISKPVVLDVEYTGAMKDPYGNFKVGFLAEGKINRREWGLNWNAALEAGGVMVSEDVRISAEIQLVKESGQKPAA